MAGYSGLSKADKWIIETALATVGRNFHLKITIAKVRCVSCIRTPVGSRGFGHTEGLFRVATYADLAENRHQFTNYQRLTDTENPKKVPIFYVL
jgi:hypothetical protein